MQALRLVWDSGPRLAMGGGALLVVQALLPLLTLFLTKRIVDGVAGALTAPGEASTFHGLAWLVAAAAGVALAAAGCRTLWGLIHETHVQALTDKIHGLLHAKAVSVALEHYEDPGYHDLFRRTREEAPSRPVTMTEGLAQILQNGIAFLAMVSVLFWFHWIAALAVIAAAAPGIFVRLKYASRMYTWHRGKTQVERLSWYYHWLLTGDLYAKEVRAFDTGGVFRQRFQDLRRELRGERLALQARRSGIELASRAAAILTMFGCCAFIVYRTVQPGSGISLGEMVMYYQAFQRGQAFLFGFLAGTAGLYEDALYFSSLSEFLALESRLPQPAQPKPVPTPFVRGLTLERVSFQYPHGSKQVLHDVDMTVRPGEIVAIVGPNGSGKTTLAKLLCRLYDPTAGAVALDGISLAEFDTGAYRRELSVLFQDYVQYNLSAAENIWLGDVDLAVDDPRVVQAAQAAGANEVLAGLKHGYQTLLGTRFEDGAQLSAGEWQRVALARAFLREAQLVILDEPTSALDARAEYETFQRLRQITEDSAVLLISHRFSTVRGADRIYVLSDGRVVESGTHAELMAMGGSYADAAALQGLAPEGEAPAHD